MVKLNTNPSPDTINSENVRSDPSEDDVLNTPAAKQPLQREALHHVVHRRTQPHFRMSRFWGNPEGSEYFLYALAGMTVDDSQESRTRQFERMQKRIDAIDPQGKSGMYRDWLYERLELARKFDLTLFDSGVLHYQNRLLTHWKIEDGGKTLNVVDVDGNEFNLRDTRRTSLIDTDRVSLSRMSSALSHMIYLNDEPMRFGYRSLKEGAAIYVGGASEKDFERFAGIGEIGETLDPLHQLPNDYLDHLTYLEEQSVRISKPKWEMYDVEEEGDHDNFSDDVSVMDMKVYSVKLGSSRIKIRIPLVDDEFIHEYSLQGHYIPSEEDVAEVVRCVQRLVPTAVLPSQLKLTFTPFILNDDGYAFISGKRNVVFGTIKGTDRNMWIREILLKTMLHELTHVFHDDNELISSLLYRCMMMDGWTMEYGNTNLAEYFAVLAENFYDHRERRIVFPNGYRLLYTLLKMRESGMKWTEYRHPPALVALATNAPLSGEPRGHHKPTAPAARSSKVRAIVKPLARTFMPMSNNTSFIRKPSLTVQRPYLQMPLMNFGAVGLGRMR